MSVSPYGFGAKSAYPASPPLDITSCRYLSIDASRPNGTGIGDLAAELRRLEELETERSMAQRWVQGRLTDVLDGISERFDDGHARLYADVLCISNPGNPT